jgi:hypothetical protein
MAKRYGIGAVTSRTSGVTAGNAPPVYPSNGAGGPGILGHAVSVGSARNEISDLMAGRITLVMVEVAFVGLIAFYLWTRSSQGG